MATEHELLAGDVDAIAGRAAADAGVESHEFLDGYIEMLVAVGATGRRLARDERDTRLVLGAAAAE